MNLVDKNPNCKYCGLEIGTIAHDVFHRRKLNQEGKRHPLGGGPTRATILPETAKERKTYPIATGFLDYFPDAIAALSHLSYIANEQHNPGQPVHWARGKSDDHADTMMRHFMQRGTTDTDGQKHTLKVAWRALAMLQKELEEEQTTADGRNDGDDQSDSSQPQSQLREAHRLPTLPTHPALPSYGK